VLELLDAGAGAPRCTRCDAVVKPDVVFFDELLPPEAIDRAYALAERAALLLVVGSSLEVYPVAGLPSATLANGGKVAVVNQGQTPIDARATMRLEGSAGEILAATVAALP
jgi:NAD-dependent deacetylase